MSGLPWVRFDTDLPDNPKILELLSRRAGHAAGFVYCCSLAYAGRHGTDGFIPRAALSRIHGRQSDAASLVSAGLWAEVDNGWEIHGWEEYQQASTTTDAIRSKQKAGAAKGNCRRWHKVGCECWKAAEDMRPRAVL